MEPAQPLSATSSTAWLFSLGNTFSYIQADLSPFTKSPAQFSNEFTFFLFILLLSSTEASTVFHDIPHKYQLQLSTGFSSTMPTRPDKVSKSLLWTPSCCPPFEILPFALPSHLMAVPDTCSPHCAWEETGQQSGIGEGVREKEWIGHEIRNSKKQTSSKQKEILCVLYSGYLTSYSGAWFPEMLSIPAATELNRTWTLL